MSIFPGTSMGGGVPPQEPLARGPAVSADLHTGRFFKVMSYRKLASATRNGSRLEQLKTLASILAKQIDNPGEKDNVASLARQYRETIREIEDIEGVTDDGDEIAGILAGREADGKPGAVRKNRSAV